MKRFLPLLAVLTLACNLPFLRPPQSGVQPAQTLPPAFLPTASPPPETAFPVLSEALLPDGEVVDGPAARDFDVAQAVSQSGGWLEGVSQYLPSTGRTPAPQILARVARENSINPRLLAALTDFECGCVFARPSAKVDEAYLLGVRGERYRGLYRQFTWAAERLGEAFYARLFGSPPLTLNLPDARWNAGSAALWHYFAQRAALQGLPTGQVSADVAAFLDAYTRRFGDPWARAAGPLLPADVQQPALALPFPSPAEHPWALTGGPHPPWTRSGPWAALDFAPTLRGEGDCAPSPDWALAPAPGRVARSAHGALVLDLDFDGDERTGWALLYLHLAQDGRLPAGAEVQTGARLGHPSCEGGPASGAHVHVARKYNGVWIPADGPLPFVLGGWQARFGEAPYQGALVNGARTVTASPYGARTSVFP